MSLKPRRMLAAWATAALLALPLATGVGALAPAADAAGAQPLAAPAFLKVLTPLHPLSAATPVTATLVLASRDPAGLANLAIAVSTPDSPLYHRWLSASQVITKYGPRASAVASLLATLRAEGFHAVDHGWTVSASGPASLWSSLLSTKLATYSWHGHAFRGQDGTATLPAWMAGTVQGVTGLTNFVPPAPATIIPKPTLRPAERDAALRPGQTRPASVTASSDGFTVTATIPGGANKPTGMPVHVILQASYFGSPDTASGLAPSGDPTPSTSTGQAPFTTFVAGLDGGDTVLTLYSHSAMTVSEQVTVYSFVGANGYPVSGYPSVTLTLPPISWSGPTTIQALTPGDMNQAYGATSLVSALQGRVPNVGVFEATPPTPAMLNALATFVQQSNIASPTVSTLAVSVGPYPAGAGWGGEENMDLQDLATAAPGAHITVFSDPAFDVGAMLQAVMNHPVSAVSFSFGAEGIDAQVAPLAQALTVEGVSLLVSAGDSGSQSGNFPQSFTPPVLPPAVSEPADLSTVTAVGGTDVAVTQAHDEAVYTAAWGGAYLASLTPLGQQEVLEGKAASGGGYSTFTPIPSYQASFLPAGATGRGVPDIAVMADPGVAGLLIVGRQGTAEIGGGTSQGAPLMAGWVADMDVISGHPAGSLNPLLYSLAAVDPNLYTQAVAGDNGAYQITAQDNTAGTWNPLTGLGSPNISALAQVVMNGTSPSVFVTAPSSAPLGSTVTLTGSSLNLAGATYQFWVRDPRTGAWQQSGGFGASTDTFTPAVPGTYQVMVDARSGGGSTIYGSSIATVTVTTTAPMVSDLMVDSTAQSTIQSVGSSVTFTANATDPNGTAEYQFWMRGPAGGWRVVQNYSTQNSYTASNLQAGSYAVAVYALDASQVASGVWSAAYVYATVVNVASAVALTAPATAAAGVPLTVRAHATGLTEPVYQFWVEAPNGTWSQSGAYQTSDTYTFTPSATGSYRVVVYAKDPQAPATAQFAVTAAAAVDVTG